jgi:hypothetical protein
MTHRCLLLLLVLTFAVDMPVYGDGPSFHPDTTFKGGSLTGWHTVGAADWHAENGELIGTPKEGGGWLMLNVPFKTLRSTASSVAPGDARPGSCSAPKRPRTV